ncbi:MAG: spermidine/putrescine ABC transporter substrate-binding protein [Bryobacteraceae bacterium]
MKRRPFLLSLAAVAGACRAPAPRLNVFNWSEYLGNQTLADFREETGIEVRYSVYESNEELLAKVFSGNSGWDVVFPSNYFIEPMREKKLLAPMDHGRLTRLDNLDATMRSPVWDRKLDWCVPYMWGATGIAYRRELTPAPTGWADLWDARLRGRLTMLDDPADTMGAALKKRGLPLNSPRPEDLRIARDELLAQKPLVRAYINVEARDQLVAGDLLACHMWATTAQFAIDDSDQVAFVYPREGFPLYADNAVILRESPRKEMAHRFIDFLLRPEIAAAIVVDSRTATANAAARKLLPEAMRSNPVVYPDAETLSRGEWFAPLPVEAQRLRDRYWTEVKSG